MTVLVGASLALVVLVLRRRFGRRRQAVTVQLLDAQPSLGVDPQTGQVHGGF